MDKNKVRSRKEIKEREKGEREAKTTEWTHTHTQNR
jgi:hypothetical protein